MKKIIPHFLLLLILLQFNAFAQDKEPSTVKIKAYYNFSKIGYTQTSHFTDNQYLWRQASVDANIAGEFSLGVIVEKSQTHSHEFELMPISIQHIYFNETAQPEEEYSWDAFSNISTRVNSRFRYQYNYIYPIKNFDVSIGLFSMANLFVQHFDSRSSTEFKQVFTQTGLVFGLTPGIEIPINEKLFWSLDVPIGIAGLHMKRMNYSDPSINAKERVQTVLKGEMWYQGFQVRLGLGMNL